MSDEITELFEAAAIKADRQHRDDLWSRFVDTASATDGPGGPDTDDLDYADDIDSGDTVEPTVTVRRSPPTDIVELDSSPSTTVVRQLRPNRRPLYTALAVAAAAVVAIGGIALVQRKDSTTVAGPSSSEATTTTTIETTTTIASTVPPTSATSAVATTAKTTTAPKPTTTPATTAPSETTVAPPKADFVIDALKVGKPKGEKVATFDGAATGDFQSFLSRTPQNTLYYAGYTGFELNGFLFVFFADSTGPQASYSLPTSFLRKYPNGTSVYRDWHAGPERVAYGLQYAEGSGTPNAIVAVPTTGSKNGSVAAKVDLDGKDPCRLGPDGVMCGKPLDESVKLKWIKPDGSELGQRFEGDWSDFGESHSIGTEVSQPISDDTPIIVKLGDDRTVALVNLRSLYTSAGNTGPSGGLVNRGFFGAGECLLVNVGWEGNDTSFSACVKDGKVKTAAWGNPVGSLPGGNLDLIVDGAYYAVEANGTRYDLVKYSF
jgi:hypothetical protein